MIRYANDSDFDTLKKYEHCISDMELKNSISQGRVLVMFRNDNFLGWLRFNLFWDNTPFMNMLYILDGFRGRGCGTELTAYWETEMAKNGYDTVLTSTLSNEQAQFFYRKKGYTDCGSLLLHGEPLEIILCKKLVAKN